MAPSALGRGGLARSLPGGAQRDERGGPGLWFRRRTGRAPGVLAPSRLGGLVPHVPDIWGELMRGRDFASLHPS